MIEFKDVSIAYEKGNSVISALSFSLEKGEAVGLIGANGAGKTTLLKCIPALLPYEGSIKVCGLEVRENIPEVRKKIGFLIQNSDNQMFMPRVKDDIAFGLLASGMSRENAEIKVGETLERLGISYLKDKYNHRISGGEKKMAAIAAVLAMEPEALIFDEPAAGLDPYNRRLIINTLNSLDCAKLITSHDLDLILDTASRVILLSNGKIAAEGSAAEILKNKELLEACRLELPQRFASAGTV